jgi:hypothetical protein
VKRYFYLWPILITYSFLINSVSGQILPDVNLINQEEIQRDLYTFTGDIFQGRDAGLAGGHEAGDFILNRLKEYQLKPLLPSNDDINKNTYYQEFQIIGVAPENMSVSLSLQSAGNNYVELNNSEYSYFFNSPQKIDLESDIIFAGYGIEAPEYNYNDFSNIDIDGKVVLAFYGEPLEKDSLVFFNGSHQTKFYMVNWKAREVAKRGGRALILIPTPENSEKYNRSLQRKQKREATKAFILEDNDEVPVIYLSAEIYESWFGEWAQKHFQAESDRIRSLLPNDGGEAIFWKSTDFPVNNIRLALDYKNEEIRDCRNILTMAPGTDNVDEYILVGAHYDHEGIKDGQVLSGADDNASGCIANLYVAKSFSPLKNNQLPRRHVIFAFWDAEEKGTLGSYYFTKHAPIPLNKIKTVFNMDMIGRDASFNFMALRKPMLDEGAENKVMLFYSAQSPGMREYAELANQNVNLNLLFDPNVFFTSGSDHVNFHSLGIPVVYYFTGFHTDYTSINDTADKINFNKLTRITRHIAHFAYLLADRDIIPYFNKEILTAPEGDFVR